MKDWKTENWRLDRSTIVYSVESGSVYGGSTPGRTVKKVNRDSNGYIPGCEITMELDLSHRTLIMWINNDQIILDGNIGDFQYSPIIILNRNSSKVTLF